MAHIVLVYIGMACIGTAYIGMAYIVTACVVMAHTVTAHTVMAHIIMAYRVVAYRVMADILRRGKGDYQGLALQPSLDVAVVVEVDPEADRRQLPEYAITNML